MNKATTNVRMVVTAAPTSPGIDTGGDRTKVLIIHTTTVVTAPARAPAFTLLDIVPKV